MKKTLPFIALLLIAAGVRGQALKGQYGFPGELLPEIDTVKVWFLVVDTTHIYKTSDFANGSSMLAYSPIAFMLPGYEATHRVADQFNESFWMVPDGYLDDHKKPLNKNLIIWQTTERK